MRKELVAVLYTLSMDAAVLYCKCTSPLVRASSEMTLVPRICSPQWLFNSSECNGDTPDDKVVMRIALVTGCLMTLL